MKLSDIQLTSYNNDYSLSCVLEHTAERLFFNMSNYKAVNSEYLVYDAFVVGLLPIMIEKKQDVIVDGYVNDVLLNQLNNHILPILCEINNLPENLKIKAIKTSSITFNTGMRATAISCGVDSLTTIKILKEHLQILTFFNAGSHGPYGRKDTEVIHNHRYENVVKASKKLDLPLLQVATNLHSLLMGKFQSGHSFLNISCAISLGKVIGDYYYASAYTESQSRLLAGDTSNFDHHILPRLFSSYFRALPAIKEIKRIDRVNILTGFKVAQEHLDVCVQALKAKELGLLNCSTCEKCLRTLITLETMGALEDFKGVFDLKKYHSEKDKFIACLFSDNISIHDQELLSILKVEKLIKPKHKILWQITKVKRLAKRLLPK